MWSSFILYVADSCRNVDDERSAFIEVTLGEFSDGTVAQFNEERNPNVATRPNPSREETPEPDPEPDPTEQPETAATGGMPRRVNLPEQEEEVPGGSSHHPGYRDCRPYGHPGRNYQSGNPTGQAAGRTR